jgi:ABC-type Fe3+-hydroxamate transport system substrate-binding protein
MHAGWAGKGEKMFKVFHEILGDYADVPEKPKRIVSLYPSVTGSLVRMGVSEELVGVSSHCHLYVKGLKKRSVSSATEVNYKRLEEAKPDLVLTTTGIQREMAKALHSKGYRVFPIPVAWSLYGIIANVLLIGALVGREEEAQALGQRLAGELRASRVHIKREQRPKVYVELWPDKYSTTMGSLSFINDLVYAAGGCNIFFEKALAYFTADFGDVAAANPSVIFFLFGTRREMRETDIPSLMTNRGWEGVDAVRKGNIVVSLEGDLPLTDSGPSAIDNVRLLSQKLSEFGVLAK